MQTRLSAMKMGFNAKKSNAFIAESLGVSERTVARWFTSFRKGGLDAILERGYGIGRPSDMDEEVEAYLLNGLEHAREELSQHFERNFKYATVWYFTGSTNKCKKQEVVFYC